MTMETPSAPGLIPSGIMLTRLGSGRVEARCLRCVVAVNVLHPESEAALAFFRRHNHEDSP